MIINPFEDNDAHAYLSLIFLKLGRVGASKKSMNDIDF